MKSYKKTPRAKGKYNLELLKTVGEKTKSFDISVSMASHVAKMFNKNYGGEVIFHGEDGAIIFELTKEIYRVNRKLKIKLKPTTKRKNKYNLLELKKAGDKTEAFNVTELAAYQAARNFCIKYDIEIGIHGEDGKMIFERLN